MANSRIRVPSLEAIVDENGKILGFGSPNGDVYFTRVIASGATPVAVTGTTSATQVLALTVPGGVMGPNGSFELSILFSCTNNANTKTIGVQFDGYDFGSQSIASLNGMQTLTVVRNRGSLNSQVFNASLIGIGSVSRSTAPIDTSIDKVLTATVTLANAADTVTMEGYSLTLKPSN